MNAPDHSLAKLFGVKGFAPRPIADGDDVPDDVQPSPPPPIRSDGKPRDAIDIIDAFLLGLPTTDGERAYLKAAVTFTPVECLGCAATRKAAEAAREQRRAAGRKAAAERQENAIEWRAFVKRKERTLLGSDEYRSNKKAAKWIEVFVPGGYERKYGVNFDTVVRYVRQLRRERAAQAAADLSGGQRKL